MKGQKIEHFVLNLTKKLKYFHASSKIMHAKLVRMIKITMINSS